MDNVSMCCGKEATPKMGAGTGFICSECRQVCKIWETSLTPLELLHGAMILSRAVHHLSASPRFSVDDLQTWVLLNDMADDLLEDYEQMALCNHCATCD